MLSLLTPWNLASYIPFGGFQCAFRDWMLAQVDITFVRPLRVHEIEDNQSFSGSNLSRRANSLDRLAKFKSIEEFYDFNDLATISKTPGHLEFHLSFPLANSERPYIIFVDSVARMVAPFLSDDSIERRTELEEAIPIYQQLLNSEACHGILTSSRAARAELQSILGPGVANKLFDTPWIACSSEPADRLTSTETVFVHFTKPPISDAFGRVSTSAAFNCWYASLLACAAFIRIRKERPDARLIWLCPDWRQDPRRWFATGSPVREWAGDQFFSSHWATELAALIDSGAVIVLCERPGEAELRRLLRRSDFLIDFSIDLDIYLAHQAMQLGCVPILRESEEARELVGNNGGLFVELDRDCYRWNPLGFLEGFTVSRDLSHSLIVASELTASALEQIAYLASADRFRETMTREFHRRYCRYDSDNFLSTTVFADFVGADETRFGPRKRVRHGDFAHWTTPVPEHRLEELELVAAGASVHGRMISLAPATLSQRPPAGLVADRYDALVQNFADLNILAERPYFGTSPTLELHECLIANGEGAIDRINRSPVTPLMRIQDIITVEGWLRNSVEERKLPDEVYVTLGTRDGQIAMIKSRRVARRDLAAYFEDHDLTKAGFIATIDTRNLPDHLTLNVARQIGSRVELCSNLCVILYRGGPADPIDHDVISFPEVIRTDYEGNIDSINDRAPEVKENIIGGGRMLIRGWTTISGKDAIVPDAVFVRIEDQGGNAHCVRARSTDREDLKKHFGQPQLYEAGFTANIDTSGLNGNYTIELSRIYQGKLERCVGTAFPITIRNVS